jgi:hypothetical protein
MVCRIESRDCTRDPAVHQSASVTLTAPTSIPFQLRSTGCTKGASTARSAGSSGRKRAIKAAMIACAARPAPSSHLMAMPSPCCGSALFHQDQCLQRLDRRSRKHRRRHIADGKHRLSLSVGHRDGAAMPALHQRTTQHFDQNRITHVQSSARLPRWVRVTAVRILGAAISAYFFRILHQARCNFLPRILAL